jgi:hypothetical protein
VSKDIEPIAPTGKRHSDTNDDFAMGSLSIGRASSTSLAMSRYSSSDASDTNTDNEFMNDVSNVQLKRFQLVYGIDMISCPCRF